MNCTQFELPPFEFDAGETREFHITLKTRRGDIVDPDGAEGRFALLEYVNGGSAPLIQKACTLKTGNVDPHVSVLLEPLDTGHISTGKYVYQITIKDADGIVEIFRGWMLIHENADRATAR